MKNTASLVVTASRALSIIISLATFAIGTGASAAANIRFDADGAAVVVAQESAEVTVVAIATVEETAVQAADVSIKDTLLAVCAERDLGEECAKDLLGMAWKESRFKADAKGDYINGFARARGWFQIHYKLHKISEACAEDLECSARWSLKYLIANKYERFPAYAVQCHNGCNAENGYASSAMRNGRRLWTTEVVAQQVAVK
jgi:hypothetical protein